MCLKDISSFCNSGHCVATSSWIYSSASLIITKYTLQANDFRRLKSKNQDQSHSINYQIEIPREKNEVKINDILVNTVKARDGVKVELHSLTSALDGGERLTSCTKFTQAEKAAGTH
jgi:hypothetical protein